jgi:hypothetical protein
MSNPEATSPTSNADATAIATDHSGFIDSLNID